MALAETEQARVRRATDAFMQQRRPPPHIRPRLDLGFRILGQSVEIFEIRQRWRTLQSTKFCIRPATYCRNPHRSNTCDTGKHQNAQRSPPVAKDRLARYEGLEIGRRRGFLELGSEIVRPKGS
jgi:hypothetical protein